MNGCYLTGLDDNLDLEGFELLEISKSDRVTVANTQIIGKAPHGVAVKDSSMVNINNCTLINEGSGPFVKWQGSGKTNVMKSNILNKESDISISPSAGVKSISNTFHDS